MRTHRLELAFFLVGALAAQALAQATHHKHDWSYEEETGPSHWGELKPEYAACGTGKLQSPIDISDAKSAELPAVHFEYKESPLKIVNNGHTVQIIYAPGSFISVGAKRYELKQLHFHHPSEEHVHGQAFDMDAHLVHADGDGKLAVVAVLLKSGSANKTIHDIWEKLPKSEGEAQEIPGASVNASALLPHQQSYFTFSGSLTTPPCTEGVTWIVMQHPTELSPDQISAFSSIFPHNNRPIQPLGTRIVQASK